MARKAKTTKQADSKKLSKAWAAVAKLPTPRFGAYDPDGGSEYRWDYSCMFHALNATLLNSFDAEIQWVDDGPTQASKDFDVAFHAFVKEYDKAISQGLNLEDDVRDCVEAFCEAYIG